MLAAAGGVGMLALDHLVVIAASLAEGADWVEDALGVAPGPGGAHPAMGTHNRLLSLGPGAYLEVIAVDPGAEPPGRPRWFGLDGFAGPPRLAHWVARTEDIGAAQAAAPFALGAAVAMRRGDLDWRITIPDSGEPPFDGVVPALISWRGAGAAARLPDGGCRLGRLALSHPRMGEIRAAWPALAATPGLALEVGQRPVLRAQIETPDGVRLLG